jgi:hypothetical protein
MQMNIYSSIYWHKSIVNGKEVFRVWKNGDMAGEFKKEKQAIDLYRFLLKQEGIPEKAQNTFNQSQTLVFKKMFEIVGLSLQDYQDFDFTDPQWYLKHSWTMQQEKEFTEWMVEMLYLNSKMRIDLMKFPKKSKIEIRRSVNWFTLMYGWKLKKETN